MYQRLELGASAHSSGCAYRRADGDDHAPVKWELASDKGPFSLLASGEAQRPNQPFVYT
ncbi:MAG: hypothetical protein ACK2UM_13290 [Anaerolineales bacterium]